MIAVMGLRLDAGLRTDLPDVERGKFHLPGNGGDVIAAGQFQHLSPALAALLVGNSLAGREEPGGPGTFAD
jgi:hypothetical protein